MPVGDWIWFPEGQPATDAPVAPRYFRKAIEIPNDAKVKHATLRMTADDKFTAWLDGKELGTQQNWREFTEFDLTERLGSGKHVLAVRAENLKADVAQNPAGLVAGLTIELSDGKRIALASDASWHVSKDEAKDWQQVEFDDAGWSNAQSAAAFGGQPWGVAGVPGSDPAVVPYAMGIDREVRMIYVLKPGTIVVRDLEPDVEYSAFHFDPATGEKKPLGDVQPGAAGTWRCETPANTTHDWVLILEAKK